MPCPSEDPRQQPWCKAVLVWDKGEAGALPKSGSAMLGLSIMLTENTDPSNLLASTTKISVLVINSDLKEQTADVVALQGETEEERESFDALRVSLLSTFAGAPGKPSIGTDVAAFLKSLPAGAKSRLTNTGSTWVFEQPERTELRKVGRFWVALRTDGVGQGQLSLHIPPSS
ncbi:MAG: hypothetical protein ACI9OJ_005734 [Myxococcota bacterium]|jgi:hypothetical protein